MRLVVYCSSSLRVDRVYVDAATSVGREIARRGHALVYGGTDTGMMQHLADAAHGGGARVVGVVPWFMAQRGIAAAKVDTLWRVADMFERKRTLLHLADAFLMLPGGLGTLEEFLEAVSHGQLGLHHKPGAALNTRGFFDPFLEHLHGSHEAGFIPRDVPQLFHVADTVASAFDHLEAAVARHAATPPEPFAP